MKDFFCTSYKSSQNSKIVVTNLVFYIISVLQNRLILSILSYFLKNISLFKSF